MTETPSPPVPSSSSSKEKTELSNSVNSATGKSCEMITTRGGEGVDMCERDPDDDVAGMYGITAYLVKDDYTSLASMSYSYRAGSHAVWLTSGILCTSLSIDDDSLVVVMSRRGLCILVHNTFISH
jgi:hypothetical protein